MRRNLVRLVAPAVIAAVALAATACGGGGKGSTTVTKTTAAKATTAAAKPATTPDLSGLASAANCRQLADLGSQFSNAIGGAANSGDLKKEAQLLQEFAAKAPAEIRADFKVVADDFAKIAEAVGELKPGTVPDASALAKLQKLSTQIDSTELQQASTNITSWLQKNCSP
jgi:maltose-binding protein MalE